VGVKEHLRFAISATGDYVASLKSRSLKALHQVPRTFPNASTATDPNRRAFWRFRCGPSVFRTRSSNTGVGGW
jgi:hypothetical protein